MFTTLIVEPNINFAYLSLTLIPALMGATLGTHISNTTYQQSISKHINKRCRTLPLDVDQASKYAVKLQQAVEKRENISPKYRKRLDEIKVHQEKALKYLDTAIPLYEILKEEVETTLMTDSNPSLPKTL